MSAPSPQKHSSDVPSVIFEKFLSALTGPDVPEQVIERLRKTLLEERNFTERALKEAILKEDQLQ
ncbi:MAG: hypothetical protein ABI254_07815 [Chthoniobacterales bacterium]